MSRARARWSDGLRMLRQGGERVTLYLPVALMGLLALGSWWLVRNAPQPLQLAQERQWGHRPDYSMKSFAMKSFDAVGRLQNEMQGEEARHYPDTDRIEIDRVRMRSIDPEGRVTVATANRALTNADGSEVQLFGHVVVTREPLPARPGVSAQPRLELRSEFLHAFTRTGRLRSNRPVTLTRDQDRFTADGMEYDNLDQMLQLHGRVRGLLPSPGGAK